LREGGEGEEDMATTKVSRTPHRRYIDLAIKCPRCGVLQHFYVYSLFDKTWFRCDVCGELSASGAWKVAYAGT